MAFSTAYKSIRDAHRAHIASIFTIPTTDIHDGPPGTEQTGKHAVISVGGLESGLDHPFASGMALGMTINLECEVFLPYPANLVLEDAALVYADALAAAVEIPIYGGVGHLSVLSRFELGELTGMVEGTGDARLHLRWTMTTQVQRSRG